jgi:hypothetical protein
MFYACTTAREDRPDRRVELSLETLEEPKVPA